MTALPMNYCPFPRVVWEFLAATNVHDLSWLETLFTGDCSVTACEYRATGLASVVDWLAAELVAPSLSLTLDDVSYDGDITALGVQVVDHGSVWRSTFEFYTEGRYIRSLVIRDVPDALDQHADAAVFQRAS